MLFCPYAVLDVPSFIDGVLFEVRHYASGHRKVTVDSGLTHAWKDLRVVGEWLGIPVIAATLWGTAMGLYKSPRRTVVVLASPLATLSLMASQQVHFIRNLLPAVPGIAILASWGFANAFHAIRRLAATRAPNLVPKSWVATVTALLLAATTLIDPGLSRYQSLVRVEHDSRTKTTLWLAREAPENSFVVFDSTLGIDPRRIRKDIKGRNAKPKDLAKALAERRGGPVLVVVPSNKNGKVPRAVEHAFRDRKPLKPLAEFGRRQVKWLQPDPRLAVYRVQ